MSDSISNRQKKRLIDQGARALKARPGWDPARQVREDPLVALNQVDQASRDARVYQKVHECNSCAEARRREGDSTALCEVHLREAMGL